tara:strand:+ start:450 stop:710 length:261 start_codon:yes stop_codon:yes gene_type:complete
MIFLNANALARRRTKGRTQSSHKQSMTNSPAETKAQVVARQNPCQGEDHPSSLNNIALPRPGRSLALLIVELFLTGFGRRTPRYGL